MSRFRAPQCLKSTICMGRYALQFILRSVIRTGGIPSSARLAYVLATQNACIWPGMAQTKERYKGIAALLSIELNGGIRCPNLAEEAPFAVPQLKLVLLIWLSGHLAPTDSDAVRWQSAIPMRTSGSVWRAISQIEPLISAFRRAPESNLETRKECSRWCRVR